MLDLILWAKRQQTKPGLERSRFNHNITMALPIKLKSLIDGYCMGVNPSDAQLDEILNLAVSLKADSAEVSAYMQEMIAGPTKEEKKAKEEAERKKAEAAAKREAALKAKKAAEQETRRLEEAARLKAEKERQNKLKHSQARKKMIRNAAILSLVIIVLAILCWEFCSDIRAIRAKFDQQENKVYASFSRDNATLVIYKEALDAISLEEGDSFDIGCLSDSTGIVISPRNNSNSAYKLQPLNDGECAVQLKHSDVDFMSHYLEEDTCTFYKILKTNDNSLVLIMK